MNCSIYAACRGRTAGIPNTDNFNFDGLTMKSVNYGNKTALNKNLDTGVFSCFALYEGKGGVKAGEAAYYGARSLTNFNASESAKSADCSGYLGRYVDYSNGYMQRNIDTGSAYSSLAAIIFRNGGLYAISTGTSKIFIQRGTTIKELFGHTVGYLGNMTPSQIPEVISGRLEVGDRVLICNSQLAHRLHSERINVIMSEEDYADNCADRLTEEAINRGCGTATAMVFDVIDAVGEAEPWLNELFASSVPAKKSSLNASGNYPTTPKKIGNGKTLVAVTAIAVLAISTIVLSMILLAGGSKKPLPEETSESDTTGTSATAEPTSETTEATTPLYQTEPPSQKLETTTVASQTSAETTTAASTDTTAATTKENESDNEKIVVKNGITYVDGILIANKTYSLPSNYNPGGITDETMAAFKKLQSGGAEAGYSYNIVSGFRSYDYQEGLYQKYVNQDGKAEADRYSARPGHSEHQTGLAMDVNSVDQSFGKTPEGKWLAENCYKYGFIIRYPEDKESVTGYMYEPWHIRYLGVDLATKVYESGKCLEEYLGIDSKYKD